MCGGGERTGAYYTCVNSHLNADELAYILDNSDSKILIASRMLFETAAAAVRQCPKITLLLVIDAPADAAEALPGRADA